jgi:two-component system, chemotaxis family, protein-glutamate methylesterase/glutaminase
VPNDLKQKIRLLVVDDSAFVRRSIMKMYERSDEIQVIDVAVNGEEAVAFTKRLRPDVVTLDVRMPILDGLSALEIIMRECPTPVVMFSSLTGRGGEQTLKALELGAVDFIDKSCAGGLMNFSSIASELTAKIQVASRVNVEKLGTGVAGREGAGATLPEAKSSAGQSAETPTKPSAGQTVEPSAKPAAESVIPASKQRSKPTAEQSAESLKPASRLARNVASRPAANPATTPATTPATIGDTGEMPDAPTVAATGACALTGRTDVVAVGTSTGGPPALQKILSQLPAEFPSPILIVQHMPQGFTASLAARLDRHSALEVKEATDGECIVPGKAYVAPGGWHMRLRRQGGKLQLWLDPVPDGSLHRPSVDRLFESVAATCGGRSLAVVLTGMGKDGAVGAEAIKKAGGEVVVESEESAVVFGMPRAVMQTVAVDAVVPLAEVAHTMLRMA